jgi:hypothetical protein
MVFTLTVPSSYGLVILGGGVLPFITNIVLGGPVAAARKKYNVQYPNLYAVPGHHDHVSEPCAHRAASCARGGDWAGRDVAADWRPGGPRRPARLGRAILRALCFAAPVPKPPPARHCSTSLPPHPLLPRRTKLDHLLGGAF